MFNSITKPLRNALSSDTARKVIGTYSTRIFLLLIGIVTSIIIARILGPEKRGVLALATAVATIAMQFGNLGLHASNTYQVSRDRSTLPALLSNSLVVTFLFGGAISLAVWVFFRFNPSLAPVQSMILLLALIQIPFGLGLLLLQNLLVGLQEIRTYNIIEIIQKVLAFALVIIIIMLDKISVEVVFVTMLSAIIISFVLSFRKLFSIVHTMVAPSLELFRANLIYGLKAYLSSLFGFLILKTDILLVNYYLGAHETGLYSIAANVANMVYLFPMTVGTIIFPKLCAMNDWDMRMGFIKKISKVTGAIMVPVIVLVMLLADTVIPLLYGAPFSGSATPLIWLMPGVFIWSVESQFRRLLICDGFKIGVVFAWAICFIINIVLNIELIPSLGIKGAAIASSAALFFLMLFTIILIRKHVIKKHLSA